MEQLISKKFKNSRGQLLVEVLLAFGLTTILMPALLSGFIAGRSGKVQETQRSGALALLKEAEEAVRSTREAGWTAFAVNGPFHPVISGSKWTLVPDSEDVNGFTRSVLIENAFRDANGKIVEIGGASDPSTKKITLTVSWGILPVDNVSTSFYLARYLGNAVWINTTQADFSAGILNGTQVTNTAGGEVKLANNNRAKWCTPELSPATIDLPDGPPVAVAAYASATSSAIPNEVFVATAPNASTSAKLAYLNVTANTDPPAPTLKGTFTLDASKYSSPSYFPTGINLTNNFKTNDVKYYTSAAGKIYALLATDLPDHEVIAVQVYNGSSPSYQDPVNKIYKYWTFFNTRQYQGDVRSTPNQDSAPFGSGAVSIYTYNNRGYALSGGYLYTFDLSNIDSKTPSSSLDMVGCRIELDGYDCQPGNGTDKKYNAGETGASWGDTTPPAHQNCSDGGNVELHADNHLAAATSASDGHTYIYVAVGAGTNPELDIADVTNVPTSGTNPKINNSSCGRISGGASGWKVRGTLDFNSASGTEEAANSIYVSPDSNRAYMSSNGGIDGNHDGSPDSDQFYIINTSSKTAPKFLSGTPGSGATSGYYNGDPTNIELFPRRSLTVLSGGRAILVGQDGFPADGTEPKEYQVLNIETEATPTYCNGINYLPGFNDLTSVTEADGDNFVYMVANTLEKQLKIIQGGPDSGIYIPSGTFESAPYQLSTPSAFNRFTASISQPAQTTIKMQIGIATPSAGLCSAASYNFVGPGGSSLAYFTPAAASISGTIPYGNFGNFQNPERCIKYKTFFDTTDFNQSPILQDVTVNYSP